MDSKSVSDTIKKLREVINQVARGNFDVKITVNTNDEMGELARSFNSMVGYLKELRDELKEVSELRFKSELKYRSLYDDSTELYRSANIDNIIIDCNRAYADHLGYTKEEIIGRMSIFDHLAQNSVKDFHGIIETWKKEGGVLNKELWLKRKDGTTFPVLLSSTGLYDETGKLVGSNTAIKDMTEIYEVRKKLEDDQKQIKKQLEELKELSELRFKSELKYRSLYDDSTELYRSANIDNIIIDCNRAYADHLGYTKEEIIGRMSIFDHLAQNSVKDFHGIIETWKKEGGVLNKELWLKRKDGTTFPVLLSSTGLYDETGKLVGSNTTIKDMTEIYEVRKKK